MKPKISLIGSLAIAQWAIVILAPVSALFLFIPAIYCSYLWYRQSQRAG